MVTWPYFINFGTIANIENTAYIQWPLIQYAHQLLGGRVPFWTDTAGLGGPWPIPFGFTHTPFVLLLNWLSLMTAMGIMIFSHTLISQIALNSILQHLNIGLKLRVVALLTFLTTGALENLFWADAPEVFLNWLMLPVMLLCIWNVLTYGANRKRLAYWSLALAVSVSYTFLNGHAGVMPNYLLILAIFALSSRLLNRINFAALVGASTLSLIMCGERLFVLIRENSYFFETTVRLHGQMDYPIKYHLWNLLLKPLPLDNRGTGDGITAALIDNFLHSRTIGFGAIFLLASLWLILSKSKEYPRSSTPMLSPFIISFIAAFIFTFLPDNLLPSGISTFFIFRDPANLFGIILACTALHRFAARNTEQKWFKIRPISLLLALQSAQMIAGAMPFIVGPMAFPQMTFSTMSELNDYAQNANSFSLNQTITSKKNNARVIITGKAILGALTDNHNQQGFYINGNFVANWTNISAVMKGVSLDAIHPSQSKPYGLITSEDISNWKTLGRAHNWILSSKELIQLVGAQFIIANSSEGPFPTWLTPIYSTVNENGPSITLLEVSEPYSRVVEISPNILRELAHDINECPQQYLTCISNFLPTVAGAIRDTRAAFQFDGEYITISIPPEPHERMLILSVMHRPEWRVIQPLSTNLGHWNGLISLVIAGGTSEVLLHYNPVLQKRLRALSLLSYLILALLLLILPITGFISNKRASS